MVGEISGLTPRIATLEGRDLPRPEPSGSDHVFAKPFNLRSKSTENRALTPSKKQGILPLRSECEDDGGGDVAIFGDEDVESAAQGAVVHDFETDSLLAEEGEYLWFRK